MKKPIELSNELGVPLLKFLWKWKLVSNAGLARRFFAHTTHPFSSYNWLLRLKHAHYIDQRWDEQGQSFLWTLDRAGFCAIKDFLPPLREEGYSSESPRHDWLASAFHMGNWLVRAPAGIQLISEQELRRYETEVYPNWIPKDSSHRPDGYWYRPIPGSARIVAFEMETNRKNASRYEGVGSFYGETAQISRVLWIVLSLSEAKRIDDHLSKGLGSRTELHSFVRLNSFLKQGWSAPIEYGPGVNLTIESFLRKALGISENEIEVTSLCHDTTMSLLETRIRQSIPATSGARCEGSVLKPTTVSTVVSLAPYETRLVIQPEVS